MRRLSADPTLHFFCGKAGAGKTAVASHIAQDQNAILISEDIWLLRLFGDEMKTFEDYIRVSQKLKTVVGPLTVDLLNAGQSVVLDFQANTQTGRGWFRSVFAQAGSAHVLRNIERPEGSHHVTEEVFFYVSSFFQAPEENEGFNVTSYAT